MYEKAQARFTAIQADLKTAHERREVLQKELTQLEQFFLAAQGALEVLQDLMRPETDAPEPTDLP